MKIYNKKEFISGLVSLFLGAGDLLIRIGQQNIKTKTIILSTVLLLMGFNSIIRSLSLKKFQEDKLENLDERNILIKLKSQSKAFEITRIISYLLVFILIVMGGKSGEQVFFAMALSVGFMHTIFMFSELFTYVYYESKN